MWRHGFDLNSIYCISHTHVLINININIEYGIVMSKKLLVFIYKLSLHKQATIHQVTTMVATSTNVLFPGPNHLLTTGTDDPTR